MIYISYIVLAFTVMQLVIAFVNLLFKQRQINSKISQTKLVSILIPARNEEKNIINLISDLQHQKYQNIEIIIFDDQSTDKTPEIVSELSKGDKRIRLLRSEGLPPGWLGKNYACHKLSEQANGLFYLFLDADVSLKEDIISSVLGYAEKHKLGLLTVFPVQVMHSIGEWITVPLMNYILLSLLPLVLVRKLRYPSLAAANGQFMLFHSGIYNNTHPHERMKNEKVEDIAIAAFYKRNKIKMACLTGYNTVKCRMYRNFNDAVNGFSKNIIAYFGNSFLAAFMFWVITTFGFLAVVCGFPSFVFFLYLLTIMLIRIITSYISRQNILNNLIYIIPQNLAMGLILRKALIQKIKNQYEWKGRFIR